MTTPPNGPEPPRLSAPEFVFLIIPELTPSEANTLALLSKLRAAFPELVWQGGETSSGGIQVAGESREIRLHLLRKEPRGPFTLTIRLAPTDMAAVEAEALKTRVMKALVADTKFPPSLQPLSFDPALIPEPPRLISPQPMPLQTVVYPTKLAGKEVRLSQVIKAPSPTFPRLEEPIAPKDFAFESVMSVPDVMEPAIAPRLRKAFPELRWEDRADHRDKVQIEGSSRETPERVVISIVRNESAGLFTLWITVEAGGQTAAVALVSEMIERVKAALLGWSQFYLPPFKTRPGAGIEIDRKEIVELVFPLERGQIRLMQAGAVIVLSRILLEALSVRGEILDSRAQNLDKYPESDHVESRAARARGAAARLLLRQGVSNGPGKDLDVEIDQVREAHSSIGELLENGLAQVIPYGAGAGPSSSPGLSPSRIQVHYFGRGGAGVGGSGYISYSGVDGEAGGLGEFLRLDWWRELPATAPVERTHAGYSSGFRSGLDREEITARLGSHPEFRATSHNPQDKQFLWCGTAAQGSRMEIWSKPEKGLYGLSILVHAAEYFEIRKRIHELLEAKLVVNSALEEILVTYAAGRDLLELDGQGLTELPSQIGMLTQLEVLSLSDNQLTCLPAEIGMLSKLVELAVDDNCLTELTSQIGRLTNLEILLLSNNKLRALPASIGDLTSLGKLNLDNNQLRRLPPEIGKLAKLRRLNIQDNRLTELPIEFAQLDGLQDFDWEAWEAKPRRGLPPRDVRHFIAYGNPWSYPPTEIMKKQVHVIRDYLKANPISPSETAPYAVDVDDNYHHGDGTYRYQGGAFSDCGAAVLACQKIVDEFFANHKSDTAQDLLDSYRRFGEEPRIRTSDPSCVFSAGTYAEQRCQELAPGAIKPPPSGWDNPLLNGNGMNVERWASQAPVASEAGAAPRWTPPACPVPPPLPRVISSRPMPPAAAAPAKRFRFQSIVEVPAMMEPTIGPRLKKEFHELKWQDHAENWDKVRMEGNSQNAPRPLDVIVARKDSPGPFVVTVTIGAQDQMEAVGLHNEVIRRLTWALIGWSPFPLHLFKADSAHRIETDREETVSLRVPLEGPQITIFQLSSDILISRILVEALSLHREVVDGWIKAVQRENSVGDDPGNREALMRGEAARVLLRQSVSTDASNALQVPLVLVRPARPLLGELLALGLAQVVQYGRGGRAPGAGISPNRINVRYAGSSILYSAADGEAGKVGEFLRLER